MYAHNVFELLSLMLQLHSHQSPMHLIHALNTQYIHVLNIHVHLHVQCKYYYCMS